MNEYTIARLWRDARVTRIFGGTNEIMKLVVARSI
jgi:alkylation response protein AidB-like acyl-CoA dehydrogenase